MCENPFPWMHLIYSVFQVNTYTVLPALTLTSGVKGLLEETDCEDDLLNKQLTVF